MWVFETVRRIIPRKNLKAEIIRQRENKFDLAVLKESGSKFGVAFCVSGKSDKFDFATELACSGYARSKDLTYIEKMHKDECLFVQIKDGLPERIRLMNKGAVEQEVSWLLEENELVGDVLVFGDFDFGDFEYETLSDPLTETIKPSVKSFFQPASQLLKPEASKKRHFFTLSIVSVAVAIIGYSVWPEEREFHTEDYMDVNAPYVRAIEKESFDFHTRMLQLYAFHRLFDNERDGLLKGWTLSQVNVGRRATIFTLMPEGSDTKGVSRNNRNKNVAAPPSGGVKEFIDSEEFTSLVGSAIFRIENMTIELTAINNPINFDPYSGKHNVRELYHEFSRLSDRWVPGASLNFIGDKTAALFVKSEFELDAQGVFLEDLIGFGGMLKDYPITFDTTNKSKSIIGDYKITKSGRVTGQFSLTSIGKKDEVY